MTHRARRFIFLGFIALFLLIGSGVVLYSFGWRLNFENFRLQKTGAIALQTLPADAAIKLDGRPITNESGLIQKHTLISNLLPKTYELRVEKEGYFPYIKKLEVEPALVTEALDIILIPKNIPAETALSGLRGSELVDLAGNRLIVKNEKNGVNYLYNLENASSTFNINTSFANLRKNPPLKIKFHPFEPDQLLVETRGGLNMFDFSKLKAEAIIESPLQEWEVMNSAVYFVQTREVFDAQTKTTTTAASLYSFNLIFKNQTSLLELEDKNISLPISKLTVSNSGDKFAFSDSAGKLFLYDRPRNTFKKISDNSKFFEFSPNNQALATLDYEGKISVKFLEDWHVSIRKPPGDEIALDLSNKKNIQKFEWYRNSFNLMVMYPNRLDFAEIDTRSEPNIYNLVSGLTDLFYNPAGDLIYFTENSALYSAELTAGS